MATIPDPLRARLTHGFGHPIDHSWDATGGCINQAVIIQVANQRYFLKWNAQAPPDFFAAEAHGLQTLRNTATVNVPEPLEWEERDGDCPAWLLLELVEPPRSAMDRTAFGRQLGHQLAALHQSAQTDHFGLERDNFIGALPQRNPSSSSWMDFL
ncbi:MAG: fructosamine kinase family protein, partial [Myxococcota bacterium]